MVPRQSRQSECGDDTLFEVADVQLGCRITKQPMKPHPVGYPLCFHCKTGCSPPMHGPMRRCREDRPMGRRGIGAAPEPWTASPIYPLKISKSLCNEYGLLKKYAIYIEFIDDLYGIYRCDLARLSCALIMIVCGILARTHTGGWHGICLLIDYYRFFPSIHRGC